MDIVQYPDDFPKTSVSTLLQAARDPSSANAATAAHAAWNVQGYAQHMLIGCPDGEPDHVIGNNAPGCEPTACDPIETLAALEATDGQAKLGKIDWKALARFAVEMALKFLV